MTKAHAIALREQMELSNKDICATLQDELNDMFPGEYCCLCEFYGDDESGDVVYYCNGETWKAPYEIGEVNGKRDCAIDDDEAINVVPRTVYDEEADEEDHMVGMSTEEAAHAKTLTPDERRMLLSERFISKSERDSAESGDFAGKGKSFPILKPGDVMAAVRSMGRAGSDNKSTEGLKASIIRIAKRKGWAKYLPKAWQDGGDSKESAQPVLADELALVESAATLEPIVLREARADYEIKLIAPGKGSSAFYPKEVLQRDGPKVFKAGTHVYLNHPTAAEEAARPEGDVANLAGVLTTDASYSEAHAKGEGLYARMKVFADHAQTVEEKAPHVGMSIRASGRAESDRKQEGLPVLKEILSATSVDVVTHAGAGGMILTEAAKPANQKENEMTPEEVKKLIEADVAPFRQRAMRADAKDEAQRLLKATPFSDDSKEYIVNRVLAGTIPVKESGEFDPEKFGELVVAESKALARILGKETGSGQVRGMGSGIALVEAEPISDKKRAKLEKRALKEARQRSEIAWQRIGLTEEQAKVAARGREQVA